MPESFLAVDTGGTFTDLVAFDPVSGALRFTKSLTTHHDPLLGIFDCIQKTDVTVAGAALFKHGTTLVINTLIERSGPEIALVTTRGFRDVLELARGNRIEPFDLFYRRHPPLVKRTARYEIDERVSGDGSILTVPQRAEVEALAAQLRISGVKAVAISFLNAYLEPANENCVTLWLRELLPGIFITCATDLSREWYEYERTSTVTANAYTGPGIARYVKALDARLKHEAFTGQLLLMGSNGGMIAPLRASDAPVVLIESGPIGGCIGAGVYGAALGISNLIAFDMGGTTAKAAIVQDGQFDVVSTYYVGGPGQGLPIRTPVVDIVEVGAGGGSIAWVDEQHRLRVGPRSAGSQPGPVAYGRGGQEPTVTDANLLLGRLDANRFQGGEMVLDVDAARAALRQRLALPLGYEGDVGLLAMANGIIALAAVTMSGAIKRITVERGKDPRDFVLFAYGGGGPLHSVELARELGMRRVIIPPEPGNFSAVGMLLSDMRRDAGRTFLMPFERPRLDDLRATYADMEVGLRASLTADFGDIAVTLHRYAEMRYVGQFHTVRVAYAENGDIGDGTATHALGPLRSAFEAEYEKRYGHLIRGAHPEIVSLHVVVTARSPRPALEQLAARCATSNTLPQTGTRLICFSGNTTRLTAAVYQRVELPHGFTANGPAVIEEYGSTTLIGPDDRFEIGQLGEIHIHVAPLRALARHE